jgi:hypothetical protein
MTCEEIIAAYINSVKDQMRCRTTPQGRLSIQTPYLYADHDNIELFLRQHPNRVVVSDLGETLKRLDTVGMDVSRSSDLYHLMNKIATGFGVGIQSGVLVKDGPPEQVGQMLFDVLLACQAVGDLIYGSRSYQPLQFKDEVAEVLEDSGIAFFRGESVTGNSGTAYKVDFRIRRPDGNVFVQTLAPSSRTRGKVIVNSTFRMWSDIEEETKRKISLVNDEGVGIPSADQNILSKVSRVLKWSERPRFLDVLRGVA